jgi:hypothetical protein
MHILRIEHPVPSYDAWKDAFDGDPIGREEGGVTRYRILRDIADPAYVQIDLEFDDRGRAEAFHERLRELWSRVDVMRDPRARIVEVAETHTYRLGREDD